MVAFPHAKINLGLNILEKRPDGYHNISSCLYPIPWCDILEIQESPTIQFEITGAPISGEKVDNLCIRAYNLVGRDFKLPPIQIHLHKLIPTGAGLGGGSSDGAFMLTSLNSLFELGLSQEQLVNYASQLGSDCAFFLNHEAQIASSRGEVLDHIEVELKEKYLLLIHPPIHIGTTEAYSEVTPNKPDRSITEILAQSDFFDWKSALHNDFEKPIFQRHPEIADIKNRLYKMGALYASMSGSGSAVFGIFEKDPGTTGIFPDSYAVWGEPLPALTQ